MGNKHSGKVSSEESLQEIKASNLYVTRSSENAHSDEETTMNNNMSTRLEENLNDEIDNLVVTSPDLNEDQHVEASRNVKLTYLTNNVADAVYSNSRSISEASFKTVQFGSAQSLKLDRQDESKFDDHNNSPKTNNSTDSAYNSYAIQSKKNSPTGSIIYANPSSLDGAKQGSNDYMHNTVVGTKEKMGTPIRKSNDYYRRPIINPLPIECDSDNLSLKSDLCGLQSFNSISVNDETAENNSSAILPQVLGNNVIDCQYDVDQTGYLQSDHAVSTNHKVVCEGTESSHSNCETNESSNMGINTSSSRVMSRPPTGQSGAIDIVEEQTVSPKKRRLSLKRKNSQSKLHNENKPEDRTNLSDPDISLDKEPDHDRDKPSVSIEDSTASLRSRSNSSPHAKYALLSSNSSHGSSSRTPVTPSQVQVDDNADNNEIESLISEELNKPTNGTETNSMTESYSSVNTVEEPQKLEDMDFLSLLRHLRKDTAPYAPKDYKPPIELCKKKKKKKVVVST
ncbi:unnamed protein product [Owenia fusiformis]|uniref:Uncharacterized protein n=2 Tax=Owenia fusiformis TaxID=6347 RepID=A0A8J1UXI3_OWEFU|nr:unnamed protein product [Owenia fusiformis]